MLRVIRFLFACGLFVTFPYVLCTLCFSSCCCLFIDFLNVLQVLCFSFSHCLFTFSLFPYLRLFVNFPYVLWVLCFCFIMVCLLIPLMCSKVSAFHFLKEHSSIFLTCSGSSFIFLAAWFFLSLVVLLLMQLLCGKLPFSLFLNFSSASICIPLCSLFCKLYTSSCYQLDCFHLHFVHICCCL